MCFENTSQNLEEASSLSSVSAWGKWFLSYLTNCTRLYKCYGKRVFKLYFFSNHTANMMAAAAAKSLQSCPTLCDPIGGSPPGSSVPGTLQARTLGWVAISFSNAWKVKSEREVVQSCPTLSDPMDCSLPGSSVHGIFQARVLEWGAIAFSNLVC